MKKVILTGGTGMLGLALIELLIEKGIAKDRIRKYGFAFSGKTGLIGK